MGAAIARKLADARFELTLWNRTAERARAVGAGRVAATAAEAAASADIVLSILYDAASLREVYGGLEPPRRQVFVEMSTAGPEIPDELAAVLEAAGPAPPPAPLLGRGPGSGAGGAGGRGRSRERGR